VLLLLAVSGLAAVLAAGCSGEGLPLAASAATADVRDASSTSATFPGTGAVASESAFNPFAEQGAASTGGRDVIANPSLAEVMQTGTLPDMAWGRADAPVTVIKYASLTCPYCRRFHLETFPQFKREYVDSGKVRFVIREFPIGKSSGTATIALRCAGPDKYLDLYGKFLTQQAAWVAQEVRTDAIYKVAAQVGMTRAQFDACLQNQGMIDGLKWVKERGRKLGIVGTPNFFVQGRLVKSTLGAQELRGLVEASLKAPAGAVDASSAAR
jgi:protein-disulfide isomerase